MESFILDTYAVIQYFKGEKSGSKVKELFEKAKKDEIEIYMHLSSVIETYYVIYQRDGEVTASNTLVRIKRLPITLVNINDRNIILIGRCKATKEISFADSFVVGCAIEKDATIVTGDPEFKEVEDIVNILWLS